MEVLIVAAALFGTRGGRYMEGIKLYGIGIKDDPVPGEKRGKGMQRMNSSYWMLALAVFIQHNFEELRAMVRYAHDHTAKETLEGTGVGFDFRYFVNCSNALFIKAEAEGLKTKDSIDYFLMAAWLAMAAAEVDGYRSNSYAKYSTEERAEMRAAFYARYLENEGIWNKVENEDDLEVEKQLGKYAIDSCRIDLIPSVALERLGLHNELCSIKWSDPTGWQRNGFQVSPRIDSLKRHFESVHARDYSEDHISHLIWGFMAIYHVNLLYPELNDMPNFEALRSSECGELYYTKEMMTQESRHATTKGSMEQEKEKEIEDEEQEQASAAVAAVLTSTSAAG
jgi:hypothetical protein